MVAEKLLGDDKITACIKQICLLGVICKVSNRKTLSGETFCFLEKHLLSIFNFCASSNILFSYELLISPQPTFLEMYCYFPVILFFNFVQVIPVTVVTLL